MNMFIVYVALFATLIYEALMNKFHTIAVLSGLLIGFLLIDLLKRYRG
jgi:hypothetical protein